MTCLPITLNCVQIVFRRHILISKVNIGGIGDILTFEFIRQPDVRDKVKLRIVNLG